MTNLRCMGSGGGGNSSTSHLSATATPFSADYLSPMPNPHPLLHYTGSPYAGPWPTEPGFDPTKPITEPVTQSSSKWSTHNDDYTRLMNEFDSYYSSYAPTLAVVENLLAEDEGSRYNVGLTSGLSTKPTPSLFDFEYGPKLVDSLGFGDGKGTRRSELDGKFSLEKKYVAASLGYDTKQHRADYKIKEVYPDYDFWKYQSSRGLYEESITPVNTPLPGLVSPPTVVESPCWKRAPSSQFGYGEHSSHLDFIGRNEKECGKSGVEFSMEKTPLDDAKIWTSPTTGVELSIEDGSRIAVRAAEKVLASPNSLEDSTEVDVPTMVKTMHGLSELLQSHISSDVSSLGEESSEILKNIISNLNTCLSKEGVEAESPKDFVEESSSILGNSSIMGIIHGKKDEILPSRNDLTQDDDMAKAIQKVLEQNFVINDDVDSETLLFKSLWLESEALLCSMRCKARFERMKILMEETEVKSPKENEDASELTPKLCLLLDPTTVSEVAGGEDEDSVIAKSIIKKPEENSELEIVDEEEPPRMMNEGTSEDETIDLAVQCSLVGGIIDSYFGRGEYVESCGKETAIDSVESAIDESNSSGNSSTDWEHVEKEDF